MTTLSFERWSNIPSLIICFCLLLLLGTSEAFSQAQSNAANLSGYITSADGRPIAGATVKASNPSVNIARSVTTNESGFYQILRLPPGVYEVSIEATSYKRVTVPTVTLTVGQLAELNIPMEVGELEATVNVSISNPAAIEVSRTAVAETVDQSRIENLPINERTYLNFALTTAAVARDTSRPVGPAPTTGLSFGGQRGRSNAIQVDGVDYIDNSINTARLTVSQEAVKEFQVVTNSFAPEFGRTAGGVVNVVTKEGTNDLHGNLFGFLRHRSIQARNPFAPIDDPSFTRAQYGATLGGPIKKDQTFFFFAFEQRRRQETGFFTSNVSQGLNGDVTIPDPSLTQTFGNITQEQAEYIRNAIASGNPTLARAATQYAYIVSSGGSTSLLGTNPLISGGGAIPAGQFIGSRFLLSGAPVPLGSMNANGQPTAFRALRQLDQVYPIAEETTLSSLRIDHQFNADNLLMVRMGYNPSRITGLQDESQNQSIGQNDFSRTGIQRFGDGSIAGSLVTVLSKSMVNDLSFNFARRRATFNSQNRDGVAVNIAGTAFFGPNLYSPVARTEKRYQFMDTLNIASGNHNYKFGVDISFINADSFFFANSAGLFNFGGLKADTLAETFLVTATPSEIPAILGFLTNAPDITPVQQYGLGLPSDFTQGFGNPRSSIKNRPLALFAQDSWRARPNLTLNYGLRYDLELTKIIDPVGVTDPLSGITLSASDAKAAQDAVGVVQGFPRDKNNFAPRVGIAWDVNRDAKTVVRAAYGMFYDHPPLAIAYNADISDGFQQQQLISLLGNPIPTDPLNASQIFQGTVIPGVTPGVAAGTVYQYGQQRFSNETFPGYGPVLPFVPPVAKDFEYAYAHQANLSIERAITRDLSVSASYLFVGTRHLAHPQDINTPQNELLIENFIRYANRAPGSTRESLLFGNQIFPLAAPGTNFTNILSGETFTVLLPGVMVAGPRGKVISPAAANFFRPNAPNYFLVKSITNLNPQDFNAMLDGTLRTPGVISPYGNVIAHLSDGNSSYNALVLEAKKRFSKNFQFNASYNWSHAIDDSSDLQPQLIPQNNRNFGAERSTSLFDQRHRFIFSGVLTSPSNWTSSNSLWRKILADFTLAPIVEIGSGHPFNILTGVDTNNDLSIQNDRPDQLPDGTLVLPQPFTSGNLGRNRGITRNYASFDLRLARVFKFGERYRLSVITEAFNLFNHFNEAAASPFYNDVNLYNSNRSGNGGLLSRPTAAFDPRQFQIGLKLNF
jgi:hypothetical protein